MIDNDWYINNWQTTGKLIFGAGNVSNQMTITSGGNVGIGETSPASVLTVRKDSTGGRGGEISIVNYASSTTSNSAALNFGLENSTYDADNCNAQIKGQITNGANSASAIMFSTYNGSTFGERMRIAADGEVWINYTTDQGSYQLQVNGSIYATSFFESSDARLKNILSTKSSDNFSAIEFNWIDGRDSKKHWGYAAQDVLKFIPDAVEVNNDGMMTVNYNEAHTWKIAQLEEEIRQLKSKLYN
jgi:hypothetical protein